MKITRKFNVPASSSNNSRELTVNSFFAGIGGFDLGFQRAGFQTTFLCEINKYCTSVLRRHWPDVPCEPDISAINPASIPHANVWCGGFPCQDVSVARGWLGRDGLKGKNTGLFYPFARLVEANMPHVVLMENVTGLLNSHEGNDFAVVLKTFESLGYGVAWRVLNTRYFGAPQSRPRVYICAWRDSAQKAFNVLFESGPTFHPEAQRLGFLRPSICESTGAKVPEVAFCLAATSGRHTGTDWSRSYVSYYDEVRRLTPTECERLQGFPQGWTVPNGDFHLSDDDVDTLRYHAIGNAVSVPVVEWVARRIGAELQTCSTATDHAPQVGNETLYAVHRVRDFESKKATLVHLHSEQDRKGAGVIKWNSGGIMVAGQSLTAPVSQSPSEPVPSRFVEALDTEKPTTRYFLSPNAATGIIRRVTSQGRVLFGPLDSALRRLAGIPDKLER